MSRFYSKMKDSLCHANNTLWAFEPKSATWCCTKEKHISHFFLFYHSLSCTLFPGPEISLKISIRSLKKIADYVWAPKLTFLDCTFHYYSQGCLSFTSKVQGLSDFGCGSWYGVGLSMIFPWNHPLIDSLVLLRDNTSET